MSPSLQKLLNELDQLVPEEQWQVLGHLINQLQHRAILAATPKKSWQDLEGIFPNFSEGVDAQNLVNQWRDEWDEREQELGASHFRVPSP